jgi:CubicO group peptidase (beta-lactamase class C family)
MAFVDLHPRLIVAVLTSIILSCATIPMFASEKQPDKNATIKPTGSVVKLLDHDHYITAQAPVSCSENSTCRLEDFIRDTRVCALFVIQNREIRTKLFNEDTRVCVEGGRNSLQKRFGVASVAKSITSTWLGQALADRYHIKTKAQFEATVQTQVGHFLSGDDRRALASSYSPLSLDQVLRMRSGIAWREQSRPRLFSDEILFGRMVRERPSRSTIVGFASGYKPKLGLAEFNYSALDASVAAVVSASISRVHSYAAFQNSIWRMIGAAQPARWNTDVDLIPIGSCCFSARVDDLARFGDFVLNKGNGQIPSAWFEYPLDL